MKINEDEAHLRVEIGSGGQMTAQIEPKRKIDVLIGDAAKMDCQRAINYIKSGTAEIDKAVEEGIEDFNENATEKTTAYNDNAAEKLLAYNTNDEQKTLAYNENASDKLSAFDSNAAEKTTAFNDNYTAKLGDFNTNAASKLTDFNENAAEKLADFNDNAETKITAYDENAAEKLSAFNTNASTKTQDFNDNYSDKLSDFDANASDKTGDFNDNATAKTTAFNDNAAIKQAAVDASAAAAAISETNAANSATSASNSAGLAKQWAIGDPTEPTGNSAKYWANQASSELSGLTSRVSTIEGKIPSAASASNQLADKSYVDTADNGLQSQIDTKQDVISDLATIRAGAALGATSVQSVTTGTTNGTIKVDGSDVSVYGLGSAAYTASTDYDASGSATTAETNAKNYADSLASNYATAAQGAKADTAVQPGDLATVATTGDYDDLLNKPTIPAAQVNSDWNANSGVAQILNKPTIPTVNDATLTVTQNGVTAGTFTANASSNTTIALTDTTYSAFTGADGVNAGSSGLVPAPAATDNTKYLKGDGTWDTVTASASWGSITGTLSNQTDLDNALNAKANTDLSNLTATGKSYGASLALPSDNWIDLPIPAQLTPLTAPANGYYCARSSGQLYISICNPLSSMAENEVMSSWLTINNSATYLPVKKGQQIKFGHSAAPQYFRFVYAEGEI